MLFTLLIVGGFMVTWAVLMGRYRRKIELGQTVSRWEVRFLGGRKKTAAQFAGPPQLAIDRSSELRVGRGAPIKV